MRLESPLFQQANIFPNLSKEEEEQAFQLWQQESSIAARNQIVLSYLKLVRKMAASCSRSSPCDIENLFSAGTMGLFRAMESFDAARGIRFATYATWWVRYAMQECIDFASSIVRHRIKRVKKQEGLSEAHSTQEISWGIVSLDKKNPESDGEDAWVDSIADDRETPEESAIHRDISQRQRTALMQAWAKLSEVEQRVLTLRYVQPTKWTLEQIAQLLHMTHEGVRQIEKRSLKKLREDLPS